MIFMLVMVIVKIVHQIKSIFKTPVHFNYRYHLLKPPEIFRHDSISLSRHCCYYHHRRLEKKTTAAL